MTPIQSLQRAVTRLVQLGSTINRDIVNRPHSRMYPMEYRKVVVSICELLGSIRATGALVQASIASISRWMRRITPSHRTGKRNDGLINDIMLLAIKAHVMEQPCSTASEIKSMLKDKYNIQVSRQLVQTVLLKRLNMSFKRTRKRGVCLANNPAFRARYKAFCIALRKCFENNITIVSIDESGADARGRPLYGRALKGQPCILHAPPNDVKSHVRTSLLMAIANNHTVFYQTIQQQTTGDIFADFILDMPYPPGSILLMDNHSIHNIPAVQVAFHVKEYIPMFIPPYCPELNPIEMVFGTIKNDYYKFRYSSKFTDVPNTLVQLISKHCNAHKVEHYMHHVYKFVVQQTELWANIDCNHEKVDLNTPWKRITKKKVNENESKP